MPRGWKPPKEGRTDAAAIRRDEERLRILAETLEYGSMLPAYSSTFLHAYLLAWCAVY
jgi:hypothetical protein